jgi:hypothetical protein
VEILGGEEVKAFAFNVWLLGVECGRAASARDVVRVFVWEDVGSACIGAAVNYVCVGAFEALEGVPDFCGVDVWARGCRGCAVEKVCGGCEGGGGELVLDKVQQLAVPFGCSRAARQGVADFVPWDCVEVGGDLAQINNSVGLEEGADAGVGLYWDKIAEVVFVFVVPKNFCRISD